MIQQQECNSNKQSSDKKRIFPLSKKAKILTLMGLTALTIGLCAIKVSDIQDSLGHRTDCQTYELRKFILYLQRLLDDKRNQLPDKHLFQPAIEALDQTLGSINQLLKEHDDEHTGDQVLDYAVEELDNWHYSTEGGDTVFHSEIMPDADATVALWSSYVASLHGLNDWDFSIHVIHVTEKTVADVNNLILKVLPKEGQQLIDAISTPGFQSESFYLEGRRVDLSVYDWGIEFLFYLPTDENPLEKE